MTCPKQQILDSSKQQEFADDSFKFDENVTKLCNRIEIENTVGEKEKLLITSKNLYCRDMYVKTRACFERVNPLHHMPILGSSNSAANKYMMSKIWTNRVQLSD